MAATATAMAGIYMLDAIHALPFEHMRFGGAPTTFAYGPSRQE